jgi:hypothetical protein
MSTESLLNLSHAEIDVTLKILGKKGVSKSHFDRLRCDDFFATEVADLLKTGDKQEIVSISQAQKIMGKKDVLGPAEIKKAFDVELTPEQIPLIPFSREELAKAKKFNQFLVLRVDKMANEKPATMKNLCDYCQTKFDELKAGKVLYNVSWYKNEEFYTKDTPRLGWHLVSEEPLKKSLGENYLNQTQALVTYLKEVFGDSMPDKYQQAIVEFTAAKEHIKLLMNDANWQEAAKQLSQLTINQLCRRLPVEERYDFLIYFLNNKERLLENRWDWTFRLYSGGGLVSLGGAGADGAHVLSSRPGHCDDGLGCCFSRS